MLYTIVTIIIIIVNSGAKSEGTMLLIEYPTTSKRKSCFFSVLKASSQLPLKILHDFRRSSNNPSKESKKRYIAFEAK